MYTKDVIIGGYNIPKVIKKVFIFFDDWGYNIPIVRRSYKSDKR